MQACGCMTTIPVRCYTGEVKDEIAIDLFHGCPDEALLRVVSPYCACPSDGLTEVDVDR